MKTEVYSWRVSTDLKMDLEREARRRKMSVAAVLDEAAQDWLRKSGAVNDEEEQTRLHLAAAKCFGVFAGHDARRSELVSRSVRQRLLQKHGR